MKKLLSILLSLTVLLSMTSIASVVSFADDDYCECNCDICAGDDCRGCKCENCSVEGNGEGDGCECDCDECTGVDCDGCNCGACSACGSGDDGNDSDPSDSSDNSADELDPGEDPDENDTEYSEDDMLADLSHLERNNFCGDRMMWYVDNGTLYVFGSGEMDSYSPTKLAPWASLSFNKVVFRNGVKSVGSYAFYNKDIKSIELSSTIEAIESYAFSYCTKLTSVAFNKGLVSVGNSAFANCTSLKNLVINNTLDDMGAYCFSYCSSLVSVRFPSTMKTIPYASFAYCTSLTKVLLREETDKIDSYAFNGCSKLAAIDFSNSVSEVCQGAFQNCKALSRVTFGKLVTLRTKAFAYSGLKNVTIPACLTTIESDVFYGCSAVGVDVVKNTNAYKTLSKNGNLMVVCKEHDNYSSVTKKATFTVDGQTGGAVCRACGYESAIKLVPQIKEATLSKTSGVYNGRSQIPKIKVVDRNNATIAASNYSVSCSAGFKNVGTYTIKLTFKNNYSGTKTLSYKILPASTTVSSLTATSKGFKAAIKKQATQTTGYQIQYSTSSSFSSAKTITIAKNTTCSSTVSKLTANKKYYVRVRTYKTINKTNYYSSWSGAKTVTTKK